MSGDVHVEADEQLFASLGITAQAQEHVEQSVIDQALATTATANPTAEDGSAQGLAEQLLAVEQEAEAVEAALAAQQQEEDQDDWASSDDEAAKASELSNRQLEAAVIRQRLSALQQQQDNLQQQLSALPPEQQQQALLHQQQLRQQLQQQQQVRRAHGGGSRGRGRGRRGGSSSSRGLFAGPAAAGAQQQQQQDADAPAADVDSGLKMALVETERDRLIRCGLLTPFDKLEGFDMKVQGAAAQTQQQQQQQPLPQQQGRTQAGLQLPQQQQQQQQPQQQTSNQPSSSSNRGQPRTSGPVDEQWALLMRNAVPAAAAAAGRGVVPSDLADMANQVGRGGLPLSDLMAKAAQQTLELGVTNRPRAILMEAGEVPKQERDIIKVNPMLWRANAPAQNLPGAAAKRPKRASTLPRQKRRRHGVSELRLLSEGGPEALLGPGDGGTEGSRKGRKKRRVTGGADGQGPEGSESEGGSEESGSNDSSGWEEDWESSEHGEGEAGEQEEGDRDGRQQEVAAGVGAVDQQQEQIVQQQQQQGAEHAVVNLLGDSSSDSERDAGAAAGSEEEYLPSDVDVSARRRRRPSGDSSGRRGGSGRGGAGRRSASSAATADAAELEDADMADLVPEGPGVLASGVSSSGKSGRGRRGRLRQKTPAGSTKHERRKGQQAGDSDSSVVAAAAAAAAAAAGGEDGVLGDRQGVSSSSEEDALLAQADAAAEDVRDELADYDDLDNTVYEIRMQRYIEQQAQQQAQQQQQQQGAGNSDADAAAAIGVEAADKADAVFDGGFKVPGAIWSALFGYQRTGVKWLWELHNQRAGGIIGDEMGLGKTIQVIAYFAGLHASGMWRPSLVVAPATVLRQWMTELRTWYPPLRVYLFHESGRSPPGSTRPDKAGLLDAALSHADCSVVVTTYEALRLQRDLLLPVRWGVAVLDEGHKIRNPDAEVTLAAKQLQTVHRLIMSGSPIQNRLSELWSLFDFIFPGKLGTLPVFTAQFAIPITIGGYTNASKLQVQTAYRCAVVLRDLISPYLLRRRKADVATQLPKKTETVLFCSLTETQRDLYRAYLSSNDVSEILAGQRQALAGIDVLRKICNHPDLLQRTQAQGSITYGEPSRSGKLRVLVKVLAAWKSEGHKVLLFTQTQQMLDIIEKHVVEQGYSYHRMDGNTNIATRGRLMDDFNNNPNRFLFLLTTKVGGLGVNLTGANRVLIYDPDWNPSTDSQARERAWRIGQGRPVTIYRLITSGTIEEKVYHRQIYKSYLTNKVLQDPRQRRFFASRDITDLFTLADEHGGSTKRTGSSALSAAAAAAAAGPGAATETGRIFSEVVREQKGLPQVLPPAGATAAGRSLKRAAGDGGASGQQQQQQQRRQRQRMDGGNPGASLGQEPQEEQQQQQQQQQQQEPPLSPTARATAGLAVIAPAQDAVDPAPAAAGDRPAVAAVGGSSSRAGGTQGHSKRSRAAPAAAAAAAGSNAVAEADADDAKVLRDLFEGVGLKSLMDHTKIEGAHDPEARQADAAAAKLAERAAEKLRQSRLACQTAAVHVPTWTGRHGAAGLQNSGISRADRLAAAGIGSGSRRSSPLRPGGTPAAAAAGTDAGGASAAAAAAAKPKGTFGQVINPLLTSRPLYAPQRSPAAAAAAAGVEAASTAAAAGSPARGGQEQQLGRDGSPAAAAADTSGSEGAGSGVALRMGLGTSRAFSGQLAGTTGGAAPSSATLLAQLRQRQANAAAAEAGLPLPRRFGRGGSASNLLQPPPSPPPAAPGAEGAVDSDRTGSDGGGVEEGGGARLVGSRGVSTGRLTPSGEDDHAVQLAGQIVDFIQAAGGAPTSDALVSHFGGVLAASEMPLFKQLLRQVAKLQPAGGAGQGKVWVLKPDSTGV